MSHSTAVQRRLGFALPIYAALPAGDFPGMAPSALGVLIEQNRMDAPILVLLRQVQAHTRTTCIPLIEGDDRPLLASRPDMIGSYPTINMGDGDIDYHEGDCIFGSVIHILGFEMLQNHALH